jgi:hypothetical protein
MAKTFCQISRGLCSSGVGEDVGGFKQTSYKVSIVYTQLAFLISTKLSWAADGRSRCRKVWDLSVDSIRKVC